MAQTSDIDGLAAELVQGIRSLGTERGTATLVASALGRVGNRLGRVDVLVTQPATYLPHDRHISSDVGVGVMFPSSFDVFGRDRVAKDEGVEFVYRWAPDAVEKLRAAERRVAEDRSADRATAYRR